jgi:hypothetical protein|tara:strand:- start:216 stop:446 length:231 start_codon:yes stop_codon:yes gene_type:complete
MSKPITKQKIFQAQKNPTTKSGVLMFGTSIKPIVDYLEFQGLITILKGKKYKDKPSRTRLFPSDTLSNKLWEYALE